MNLQRIRAENGIEQAFLAKKVGTNAPMMSNFEHYKCIPTPGMLMMICKELKCSPLDIYERNELYLDEKKFQKSTIIESSTPKIYKLTVELPNSLRKVLTQENLEKCGYHSLKDFIWHCCKKFEKRVAREKENTTVLTTQVVNEREL